MGESRQKSPQHASLRHSDPMRIPLNALVPGIEQGTSKSCNATSGYKTWRRREVVMCALGVEGPPVFGLGDPCLPRQPLYSRLPTSPPPAVKGRGLCSKISPSNRTLFALYPYFLHVKPWACGFHEGQEVKTPACLDIISTFEAGSAGMIRATLLRASSAPSPLSRPLNSRAVLSSWWVFLWDFGNEDPIASLAGSVMRMPGSPLASTCFQALDMDQADGYLKGGRAGDARAHSGINQAREALEQFDDKCVVGKPHACVLMKARGLKQMFDVAATGCCVSVHKSHHGLPLSLECSWPVPPVTSQFSFVLYIHNIFGNLSITPGSIPSRFSPRFSHMGIVSGDASGRQVFSGISRFPRPFILALLHSHLTSTLSTLKTSMLRAAFQISHSLFALHNIMFLQLYTSVRAIGSRVISLFFSPASNPSFFVECPTRQPEINLSANRQVASTSEDFRMCESCRMISLVDGVSPGYPISPAFALRRCSILTSLHPHKLSRPRY
ncbi:hypothetical protein PR048_007320 [Dryococelus australis]|uniref:Uncharacterized protein n=1 Tax=Dryococelus australis TaxID=614101 RepID=A0ABQ9IDB0_9NEOP|nr:hypothetical protein PR048_007320 [Dryococelus australis]